MDPAAAPRVGGGSVRCVGWGRSVGRGSPGWGWSAPGGAGPKGASRSLRLVWEMRASPRGPGAGGRRWGRPRGWGGGCEAARGRPGRGSGPARDPRPAERRPAGTQPGSGHRGWDPRARRSPAPARPGAARPPPPPPWPRSLTQVVHGGAASSGTGSTSRSLPGPGPPLSARNFSAASLGPERNAPPPGAVFADARAPPPRALGPAPHAPAPPPPRPASARPAGTGAALGGAAAPPRGPGDRWVAPRPQALLPVFFFSI